MLGDIAIWRTDTAAEAQHALHFLCLKKKHTFLQVFYFAVWCCLQYRMFFHIYISIYI